MVALSVNFNNFYTSSSWEVVGLPESNVTILKFFYLIVDSPVHFHRELYGRITRVDEGDISGNVPVVHLAHLVIIEAHAAEFEDPLAVADTWEHVELAVLRLLGIENTESHG